MKAENARIKGMTATRPSEGCPAPVDMCANAKTSSALSAANVLEKWGDALRASAWIRYNALRTDLQSCEVLNLLLSRWAVYARSGPGRDAAQTSVATCFSLGAISSRRVAFTMATAIMSHPVVLVAARAASHASRSRVEKAAPDFRSVRRDALSNMVMERLT